ncbi:hypothetical protein TWF730_006251 [Orbilia blumenaviensis]|uniref:NYN domain-containing protein n=1 Tax=Orbilia blumenaviensis TaxID=1796055 RepID=A0AAV9VH96_9PEZI
MDKMLNPPHPNDDRSPFDLSCAIELLRSLSWYHPSSGSPSPSSSSSSSPSSSSPPSSPESATTIAKTITPRLSLDTPLTGFLSDQEATQPTGRRNPFLDILSADSMKIDDGEPGVALSKAPHKSIHPKTQSANPAAQKKARKRSPAKEPAAAAALSAIQRRTGFLQSLKDLDRNMKRPQNTAIHVFVDYSNISIGFYDSVKQAVDSKKSRRSSPQNNHHIRHISFKTLALILERGRPAAKKVLVGSTRNNELKSEARDLNYEVSILQRIPKEMQDSTLNKTNRGYASEPESRKRTGEQAVDEVLIMKILESLVDCEPSTIVLATGDGNITQFSEGFFKSVERALEKGWNVEVIAFKRTLSKSWKKLVCPQFRIIPLDGFLLDLMQ